MLPRPNAPVRCTKRRMTAQPRTGQQQAVSASLRRWLQAPGSLTARLRQHGVVTVKVIAQGRRRLWQQEQDAIGCLHGHVREVILHIDGRPAVWARSVTPLRAVKGPWRAIKGLGTRPLAELLFAHRQVHREPLVSEPLRPTAPSTRHMTRQWIAHQRVNPASPGAPLPTWWRRSVFWRHGHPLQVLESFSPWMTSLPTDTA
jgi:chorismate--pyruvate lyase